MVALKVSGFVFFQFDSEGVLKTLISGGGWEARRVVCWHFCETLLRPVPHRLSRAPSWLWSRCFLASAGTVLPLIARLGPNPILHPFPALSSLLVSPTPRSFLTLRTLHRVARLPGRLLLTGLSISQPQQC